MVMGCRTTVGRYSSVSFWLKRSLWRELWIGGAQEGKLSNEHVSESPHILSSGQSLLEAVTDVW